MKRVLLILVISLLFVSGWSHVVAAAFCPNMQDMTGCHMQTGSASTYSHEGHEGMEVGDKRMTSPVAAGEANSLERPMASCCASRPALPPSSFIVSKGAEQPRKESVVVPQQRPKAITPQTTSFAPPTTSRQHAPPGIRTQRHVLISVFLI